MGYIIIQNKGELPIWGMRLLGLSNKSEQQIGKFGTGLKESIAMLARKGLFPIIFSGTTRIDFSVQMIDDQQEICFQLSESRGKFAAGEWHGLGIHPNFGHHDWNNAWMVFREIICNAVDESGVENLYHDVSSEELAGKEGATRFYLPITPEILAAYSTVHERLLFLNSPKVLMEHPEYGRILEKRDDKKVQIFHKGVWVQEEPAISLYDYELSGLKLNESRSADIYIVHSLVEQFIIKYTVDMAEVALVSMIKDNEDTYEKYRMCGAASCLWSSRAPNWVGAFFRVFGRNAVITNQDKFYYDRIEKAGKTPIVILDAGLYTFLERAGVPTAKTALAEEDWEFEDTQSPTQASLALFNAIWGELTGMGLTANKVQPKLRVFTKQMDGEILMGRYIQDTVYVNKQIVGSPAESLAMIEELAHHISGAADFTRAFQTILVSWMAKFLSEKIYPPA